jgi:hypothetical protein
MGRRGNPVVMDFKQVASIVASCLVAFSVGKLAYRLMFEDSEDFWDCVRFSFTPDIFSLFRGEYFEDLTKSFKFSLFLLVTFGAGGLTWFGLGEIGHARDSGMPPAHEDRQPDLPAERPE